MEYVALGPMEEPSLTQAAEHQALSFGVAYTIVAEVWGDIVEFGTFYGGSARVLAAAMSKENGQRKLRLFDSFAGLPPTEHPIDLAAPHEASTTWKWHFPHNSGPTADKVRALCTPYIASERILIHDGWYKDTLSGIARDAKFALVHLDCDLYQSTFEVLDYLLSHNHLTDGCTLFFDDWYCNRGSPRFGQQAAWRDVNAKHSFRWTDVGQYGTVSRRFIVHRD